MAFRCVRFELDILRSKTHASSRLCLMHSLGQLLYFDISIDGGLFFLAFFLLLECRYRPAQWYVESRPHPTKRCAPTLQENSNKRFDMGLVEVFVLSGINVSLQV